jgi:hypothetical protein
MQQQQQQQQQQQAAKNKNSQVCKHYGHDMTLKTRL